MTAGPPLPRLGTLPARAVAERLLAELAAQAAAADRPQQERGHGPMPTRRTGAPGKYDALLHHLQALPPEVDTVTLTFAAIETLVGVPLPVGAWTTPFWGSHASHPTAWGAAGFRARLLRDAGAPSVAFQRAPEQQG